MANADPAARNPLMRQPITVPPKVECGAFSGSPRVMYATVPPVPAPPEPGGPPLPDPGPLPPEPAPEPPAPEPGPLPPDPEPQPEPA
ncbi:hypothetical protein GCM10027570_21180 [Streptomonospora sediminis]